MVSGFLFLLDGYVIFQVALLAACVRRGLKVLSAMGAGARADPTRIRVADLRESINDPLSRAVIIYFTCFFYLWFIFRFIHYYYFSHLTKSRIISFRRSNVLVLLSTWTFLHVQWWNNQCESMNLSTKSYQSTQAKFIVSPTDSFTHQ